MRGQARLGLYFCLPVVEAHGGEIGIEETATLPVVFHITSPAVV